jgi:methanogenic corrinoid protein MtbC1
MLDNLLYFGMKNSNTYPIKVVSDLTGLSIHVIRAWEKRYNVVVPERTDTNRRLYSHSDIEKLKLLSNASEKGYAIGSLASLDIDELKKIIIGEEPESKSELDLNAHLGDFDNIYLKNCVSAVKNLNVHELEKELYKALVDYPQIKFIDEIVAPLLEIIGNMWKSGEIRILHEHIATAVIRKFLTTLIDNNSVTSNAPSILIATPKGQLHELGALIIGVIASSDGWNVTYMGPDLPGEEIAAAIERLKPKIVALSIVYPSDDFTLDKEMLKLQKLLDKDSSIIAGGRSAKSYAKVLNKMGDKIITKTNEFREELDKVRK